MNPADPVLGKMRSPLALADLAPIGTGLADALCC